MSHSLNLTPASSNNIHAWLFSFGDLLTLLLCFFVVLLVNSPSRESKGTISQPASEESSTLGTSFAHPIETKVVRFGLDDFLDAETIAPGFVEKSLTPLIHETISWTGAHIESCSMLVEGPSALSWFASLRRALLIKRQIFDVFGIEASVRLLGSRCDLLKGPQGVSEVTLSGFLIGTEIDREIENG